MPSASEPAPRALATQSRSSWRRTARSSAHDHSPGHILPCRMTTRLEVSPLPIDGYASTSRAVSETLRSEGPTATTPL